MIRVAVLGLALALTGCASLPTALEIGALAVSAAGVALTGVHDCKQDGGCKTIAVPP